MACATRTSQAKSMNFCCYDFNSVIQKVYDQCDVIKLTLTLKMTIAQVVETPVTVKQHPYYHW